MKRTVCAAIIAGALAGFVNGLVGAGGGLVMYYAMSMIKRSRSKNTAKRLADSLAVCLPMSLISAVTLKSDIGSKDITLVFILFGVIGGVLGARFSSRLPDAALRVIFAAILLIGGIKMLI